MSLFQKLFGLEDPAKKAMPYLEQAGEQFKPFQQRGQEAGQNYGNITGQMAQDPAAFYEKLLSGYQPSSQYKFQRDEALRAAGNTAAAGGYQGTGQDQDMSARITQMLLGDDMRNWYQNVSGLLGSGLQGQKGLYDTGYQAAGDRSNVLGTQGQLAYNQAQNKNQRLADVLKGIGSAGAFAASFPTTGGTLGADTYYKWMK